MDGDTVRIELSQLLHGMAHILNVLAGKSHNEVHIDIVVACLPCHRKGLLRLLYRMLPANEIQGLLIHRLGIHGDTGDLMIFQNLQLLRGHAVGTSGFNCQFL